MLVLEDISKARLAVRDAQRRGDTVGLVPTMGALHEGHLSLVRAARKRCGAVAVTIFVNPAQFGPREDFAAYPRPLETDLAACEAEGVDLVFAPAVETMYPQDAATTVHVSGVTDGLCGAHRPGHFDGVTTVVLKLFNILPVDVAFFGEKDYQQLITIKRMVRDLHLPIEIVGCQIVREPDGLALSSRNAYLSEKERAGALCLSKALFEAVRRVEAGERDGPSLIQEIRRRIEAVGPSAIDYVEVVDANTLVPLKTIDRPARVCLAVRIGPARLIDNMAIDVAREHD